MAASPTIAAIIAATKVVLDAVTGIGVTHDRPRNTFTPADFQAAFKDSGGDGKLRAWTINVEGLNDEEDDAGFLFYNRRLVVIEGWLVFNDQTPTDAEFLALLETIASDIESSDAIFGADSLQTERTTTIVKDFEPIGSVLCHHGRIEFQVEAKETKTA